MSFKTQHLNLSPDSFPPTSTKPRMPLNWNRGFDSSPGCPSLIAATGNAAASVVTARNAITQLWLYCITSQREIITQDLHPRRHAFTWVDVFVLFLLEIANYRFCKFLALLQGGSPVQAPGLYQVMSGTFLLIFFGGSFFRTWRRTGKGCPEQQLRMFFERSKRTGVMERNNQVKSKKVWMKAFSNPLAHQAIVKKKETASSNHP